MNLCCTVRQKEKKEFSFENGTRVRAYSYEDAVERIKSVRFITFVGDGFFDYGPDVSVDAETKEKADWKLYLDKKEPTLVGRWRWS
jgi:hypothetical protein